MIIELKKLPPKPLVSIIVPSYNQGKYIKKTIDSILEQDYRPIEVIVVDGGSKDKTISVLHQYDNINELRWISEPDNGVVEAVNKGFKFAQGIIGAVQSSDDFYLKYTISKAVSIFQTNNNLGLVYGDYIKVDSLGNEVERYRLNTFSITKFLSRMTFIPQSTSFFRLDLFKELHGWDENLPYVPDTDFFLRMAFTTNILKFNGYWACSRSHSNQRDLQHRLINREYKRMLTQSLYLNDASLVHKMAAKAGYYLLCVRYPIHKTEIELTKTLWKAALLYPPCILSKNFPKHKLIPGYFTIASQFGKLKRKLL